MQVKVKVPIFVFYELSLNGKKVRHVLYTVCKSSVDNPCERPIAHSPKRQDKSEKKLKIKRKQKEKRFGIHELLYKTGVGSGAHEG